MAPKPTPLSEIQGDIPKDKGFLVRVIRLWIVPQRYNFNAIKSVEMVLQDDQEVRIQATIEPHLWNDFKDKIAEHGLYGLKNFRVEPNLEKYKPAPHPYRLYFQPRTGVRYYELHRFEKFPMTLYHFKSVDEILSTVDINTADLIDFVGALVPRGGINNKEATESVSRHVSFTLHDVSMKKIYCTLWEGYGDEAIAKFPQSRNDPVIVLIQLGRIKKGEDNTIALNTSFHVSKVMIDEHLPEIEDFRFRFLGAFHAASQTNGDLSSSIANSSSIGPVEKIKPLMYAKEPIGHWFYATIRRVISRDNWSYPSCPDFRCAKKVTPTGDEFLCGKCHKTMKEPVHKYNMKFLVEDVDSFTTVHMWDEQCTLLIGKTALQLRRDMDKAEEAENPPKEILAVEGKSFLFKIYNYTNDSGGGRTYTIKEFCVDPKVLELYKPKDEEVVEVYDSDDDLDLMFPDDTQGDSNAPLGSLIEAEGDIANTPTSKRRVEENRDDAAATPTTQNSSNKKLKGVKIEK